MHFLKFLFSFFYFFFLFSLSRKLHFLGHVLLIASRVSHFLPRRPEFPSKSKQPLLSLPLPQNHQLFTSLQRTAITEYEKLLPSLLWHPSPSSTLLLSVPRPLSPSLFLSPHFLCSSLLPLPLTILTALSLSSFPSRSPYNDQHSSITSPSPLFLLSLCSPFTKPLALLSQLIWCYLKDIFVSLPFVYLYKSLFYLHHPLTWPSGGANMKLSFG